MNRRGASLIICLSLVINSLVLNIPKSSFESLNNDKDLKIDSETKILTDNLCNYFQATENPHGVIIHVGIFRITIQ